MNTIAPLLTVVIPAHNPDERLVQLLEAIDTQARDHPGLPTIVSDDGSAPEKVAEHLKGLQTSAIQLSIVRSERNRGPGAARNRAVAAVVTPWVAFMDADMLPAPGWLHRLMAVAADPDGPDGIEGRVEIPQASSATPFTHATDLSGPGGAGNVAYRTDVLRRAGGFDERYFDARRGIHFREDTDLHFRMMEAGCRVVWRQDIVAVHPPLKSSYLSPIRLARRYYFDPLLSREHAASFRSMTRARTWGGMSLRRARHQAAVAHSASAAVLAAGLVGGNRRLRRAGLLGLALTWPANAAALAWKRHVHLRDLPALAAVSAVVPVVYLWHHSRGVVAFRHRPRY